MPTLACALDLPQDTEEVGKYAKDLRFNSNTEKIVFHVHLWSSIKISDIKKTYFTDPTQPAAKVFMALLKKNEIWFKAQQCAETRVAKIGWFLNSHPTDNIDQFKAQLSSFWLEKE